MLDERISKSEAARRLDRSPATITKYIRGGLPVGSDGRLSWPEVVQWVNAYVATERSCNPYTKAKGSPLEKGLRAVV